MEPRLTKGYWDNDLDHSNSLEQSYNVFLNDYMNVNWLLAGIFKGCVGV